MKQAAFEARYAVRWSDFEQWIEANALRSKRARKSKATHSPSDPTPFAPDAFAARYRELCQHLALARDRQYSAELVDRLNRLALAGHQVLYSARPREQNAVTEFLVAGFPRLVRTEWKYVVLATLLFFGPMGALVFAVQQWPGLAYYFLSPAEMANMAEMYSNTAERLGPRKADSDFMMFAYYIWNNVKIGFQTFAGGMLFGLGSLFFLIFNGTVIGAVSGYITYVGHGENFWSFVAGHSGMELTAIALSGAAGLRLAHALIAPGQLSRQQALVEAAKPAVRIMIGAAVMFVIAAVIEGFWSPHPYLPVQGKYIVGIALWVAIALYFLAAGRGYAVAKGDDGA